MDINIVPVHLEIDGRKREFPELTVFIGRALDMFHGGKESYLLPHGVGISRQFDDRGGADIRMQNNCGL